jgi:GAF domain-containing protein
MNSVSVHDVRHALNELGKLRFGEMRVEDAMHHIVQTTHAIFSVDGAGLMLADVDHHLLNAAVSDDRMKHLEELQIRHQEGPCIAAFEDKELVRAEDLTAEQRWPDFCQHAVARGVRAVLASPIPYNQDAVGVVAVMSEDRRPWSAEAELALLAFTDLAALLIATMMMGEQQTELAAQLQSALNSRAIIEQAKGVLIGQQGINAHDAYAQLRAQARAERRKIAVVSAELVSSSVRAQLAPAPPAGADAGLMQGQQRQPDQQQVCDVEPPVGGGAGGVDNPGDSEDDRRDDSKHGLAASPPPP